MIVKSETENIAHYVSHFFHNGNLETLCGKLLINNHYTLSNNACWGSGSLCNKCREEVLIDLKPKEIDDGKLGKTV